MRTFQFFCLNFLLLEFATPVKDKLRLNLVGIFVSQRDLLYNYNVMLPTLTVAVKGVKERFPNIELDIYVQNDTESCYNNVAANLAAEQYYFRNVSAFIGPGCGYALDQVARLASAWNVPIFTAGGWNAEFSDKSMYKLLTRLSFSLDRLSHFMIQILKEFNWSHVVLLLDESNSEMVATEKSLRKMFKEESNYPIEVLTYSFESKSGDDVDFSGILQNASKNARIIILLTSTTILRNILLTAYELGYHDGSYAFFAIELFQSRATSASEYWYKNGDKRNREAKTIFEALMILRIKMPVSSRFNYFVNDVIKTARTEFEIDILVEDINPVVAAFYDTVFMYVWAANRIYEEGNNLRDGWAILRKLWNSTFMEGTSWTCPVLWLRPRGLTGDIYINENGDRESDYTLEDFDPESGSLRPVVNYFGAKQTYEKLKGVEIHWPGPNNSPPLDIPPCGFLGDSKACLTEEPFSKTIAALIVLLVLASIGSITGYFVNEKLKLESKLDNEWWKINFEEIKPLEKGVKKSMASLATTATTMTCDSTFSVAHTTTINVENIKVGEYKGLVVAMKEIHCPKIVITRALRVELNLLRESLHDNLLKFFGICTEPPNTYIIMELSLKGSLRDVLDNNSITVDKEFMEAVMSDIVEGMVYLHNSPIEYHGRLKSTNLLIDKRFCVKIADFGLNALIKQLPITEEEMDPFRLLWTAPEHLRTKQPSRSGSKKGDVYSFGIILQELLTRLAPFERKSHSQTQYRPEEILDRVRMGLVPPYRPHIEAPEGISPAIVDIAKLCWAENPNERPSFSWVKSRIRKLTNGASGKHFLSSLLKRMEQYSSDLEAIVNERMQSILEEQQKVDELLHNVLPAFVIRKLKMGEPVEPQGYDSVTICFSEIIGFSALCAKSNPEEIVSLLSDIYTLIDTILSHYDVYKVETIGDCYLIASGVPVPLDRIHSREIARVAFEIRDAIRSFRPRHCKNYSLNARIGIHTGPCYAGVVGHKLPKYCIFGDTVNTASRMETNGEADRIHISPKTKEFLDTFYNEIEFLTKPRGEIQIKGKGLMNTFWLEGFQEKVGFQAHLPPLP